MNTGRLINEIRINLERAKYVVKLNERQLERIMTIHETVGANVICIGWFSIAFTVDNVVQLLQMVPKLEILTYDFGNVIGHSTMLTRELLPRLKTLHVDHVPGFYKIINLLPADSVSKYTSYNDDTSENVTAVLTKQRSLKSLTYGGIAPTSNWANNLQLDTLHIFNSNYTNYNKDQLCEILKCQPNLKDISWKLPIRGGLFKWVCNNLRQLENLEAPMVKHETSDLQTLVELKKLQYFHTRLYDISDLNELKNDSLTKLKITGDFSFENSLSGADFKTMALNLPNLTDLEMPLCSLVQLGSLLNNLTKITKLNINSIAPGPTRLTEHNFPNIRHLSLSYSDSCTIDRHFSVDVGTIVDIVRAMPNLEYLSVNHLTLNFNSNLLKELIDISKTLNYLEIKKFILDHLHLARRNFS